MVTDPIADMFTSLRNAALAGRSEVVVPYSNLKENIAKLLVAEGFLSEARKFKQQGGGSFFLSLQNPRFEHLQRLSKPGARWYVSWREIQNPPLGVKIISTPEGILAHKQARKKKVGGELIGEVW
ncbi:30S ribosomal protein S8 [candidate division WWE3 bacterium RBG_19FT_COMBO_53_11]|uniref:Small ribosomal subunit protein uS8 n=1 Tax=candidate division WWE3 bacterium RBG_19FT_COMBO_53_11 TaxID=1802613 RepID=A0A1F4UHE0_UNCKA|nr:MAG: 30S ribosomal protein S8 [candidate division WWE3 bacterium RBG_16_52_45]OGC44322.1 MAG: 30S ribosomal protein S8 [candidate division WWE3 bacterium RBG_19FT_COMBO_53_11]